MAITAKLLQKTTRPIQVGEVVLLPNPELIALGREKDKFQDIDLLKLSEKLLPEVPRLGDYLHLAADKWDEMRGQMLVAVLSELWNAYCQLKYISQSDSVEPKFFYQLPKQMQVYLRFHFVLLTEDRQYDYLRNIPFTGLTYIFRQNSLASYLYEEEKDFQRLWELKQLANLSLPKWMCYKREQLEEVDTRYTHSLDNGAIANPVTFNNARVLPWIYRWAIRFAGLTHDIAMPAGGDGIKPLDPETLCEEKNIDVVFQRESWQEFFKKIGISSFQQLVVDIVRNEDESKLGNLQNFLDRNTFIARDLSTLIRQYKPAELARSRIYQFFVNHPDALTIWDSIRIVPSEKKFLTVFSDPERLSDFLTLRVLMFRDWYYLPEARPKRTISSELIGGYLTSVGKLKLTNLLSMTDAGLEQLINQFLGLPGGGELAGAVSTETFSSLEMSLHRELDLLAGQKADLTITEICKDKINPAVSEALVFAPSGHVAPFSEVFSRQAGEITKIATINQPYYLHSIRDTSLNPEILDKLKSFRLQEIRRILNQV